MNAVGCQFMFEGDFCTASGENMPDTPFFSSAFSHAKSYCGLLVAGWIRDELLQAGGEKEVRCVTKMTFLLCSCARQLQSPSV